MVPLHARTNSNTELRSISAQAEPPSRPLAWFSVLTRLYPTAMLPHIDKLSSILSVEPAPTAEMPCETLFQTRAASRRDGAMLPHGGPNAGRYRYWDDSCGRHQIASPELVGRHAKAEYVCDALQRLCGNFPHKSQALLVEENALLVSHLSSFTPEDICNGVRQSRSAG